MKTMTFFFKFFFKKVKSNWNFFDGSFVTTYPCSRLATVELLASFATSTSTGFLRESLQRSSTFLVIVAENRRVSLSFGNNLIILFISSSKPILRIASASSIISIYKLWNAKPGVFSKWSKSRPGVATSRFTPFLSCSASALLLAPPITTP